MLRSPVPGAGTRQTYASIWVLRERVCSQLRAAWPPADKVDVAWLRSWRLDSKCILSDFEDSLRLNV
eukprot:4933881-Lingulodinium_polyedra.AAC.1